MAEISGMRKKADSEFSLKICLVNHYILNTLFILTSRHTMLKVFFDNL